MQNRALFKYFSQWLLYSLSTRTTKNLNYLVDPESIWATAELCVAIIFNKLKCNPAYSIGVYLLSWSCNCFLGQIYPVSRRSCFHELQRARHVKEVNIDRVCIFTSHLVFCNDSNNFNYWVPCEKNNLNRVVVHERKSWEARVIAVQWKHPTELSDLEILPERSNEIASTSRILCGIRYINMDATLLALDHNHTIQVLSCQRRGTECLPEARKTNLMKNYWVCKQ